MLSAARKMLSIMSVLQTTLSLKMTLDATCLEAKLPIFHRTS